MIPFYKIAIILVMVLWASSVMAQDDANSDTLIIDNYDANRTLLLDTLEANGIIPSGGVEAFTQGRSTFAGDSAQFSTFAIDNEANNVIMGITLNFAPQAESLEFCGLGLRAQRVEDNRYDSDSGSNITTIRLERYLTVGLDNDGSIFAVERDTDRNSDLALSEVTLDLNETVYVLAILLNDRLSVFANGNLLIEDFEVTIPVGGFAFLYAGKDADSSCDSVAAFAYTFTDNLVDACIISTDSTINQRSGAGTEFARVTQLQPETTLEAIGQTIGTDGFTWWLLEDDTWVREDVVNADGFCRVLPTIDSPN